VSDPSDEVVSVRGLTKSYGANKAVAGIDLTIRRGQVFALLGPNGAGKTTTVEILEGYRRRDGGDVTVLGLDPGRHRVQLNRRIGIVLQSTGVDRYLSVAETIAMYAGYYPHPRPVDEVIELVGLTEKRDARVITLSGGQQRRLDVAIALAGDPDLLFLDEPTTGFDPSARHEAWQIVKDLASLGKTVLLTTHYMDEAQELADRVAVVARGRIVAEGPPQSLAGRDAVRPRVSYRLPANVSAPTGLCDRLSVDGIAEFTPQDLTKSLHRLTGWALDNHVVLEHLEILRPTLEDVYLSLTEPTPDRPAGRMNAAALTAFQVRYVNKAFWRNPASAFFTFAFPLMFLVIFTALLGHGVVRVDGRLVHQSTYYVAEMAAFSVITACYNNIAISLTFQRDTGVLKRTNGTPLPAAVYFAARVVHALLMSLVLVAITVGFGRVVYHADIPSNAALGRFLVMIAVGAASFCALGFAVTAAIPNSDAAAPIVNATILPLLFLSGVFIPIGDDAPAWITWTARIFPVKHFADGMQAAFLGTPFHWSDVLIVAIWGVAGLLLALRFFSWEPRT
jgi:ABC-type multidrug transport system ATPase subunit